MQRSDIRGSIVSFILKNAFTVIMNIKSMNIEQLQNCIVTSKLRREFLLFIVLFLISTGGTFIALNQLGYSKFCFDH